MISLAEPNTGTQSQDFAQFVQLLQKHTEMSNSLEALELKVNQASQKVVDDSIEGYVVLHEDLAKLATDIKSLFERHPEWRGETKSVKTPYGSVEQRTATELEVPNATLTVALIEASALSQKTFHAADFLHIKKEPNLEALEAFTDDELDKLGIKRVTTERLTVKAAKVSVAKAAKASKAKK